MPFVPIAQLLPVRLRLTLACGLSVALSPAVAHGQDANLVAAAQVALQTQNAGALAKLVAPLREAVQDRAGASSALLLAWGRTEARVGEADSALSAYVDLTARWDMRGRGLLEQARLLLERGMRNGPELWYLGAEVAEVSVWADYRADLLPLLSADERRALDGLPAGPARVRWLRAFWDARAGRDMRGSDARLAEHYKRLRFARENYRSVYALDNTPATIDQELDDRGRIYIRHGAADRVVKANYSRFGNARGWDGGPQLRGDVSSEDAPSTEIWRYAIGDSGRVHVFAVIGQGCLRRRGGGVVPAIFTCKRSRDFVALESLYDLIGGAGFLRGPRSFTEAVSLSSIQGLGWIDGLGFGGNEQWLGFIRGQERAFFVASNMGATYEAPDAFERLAQTASGVDARFEPLTGRDRYSFSVYQEREREATRLDLQRGLGSDSYEYRYPSTMRVRAEPVRVGREGAKGLVHLSYAVRASDLSPSTMQGHLEYPMRLIMRAEDSAGVALASFDRKKIYRAEARLGDEATIMGREAIAVPPGTHRLRVVLEHTDLIGVVLPPISVSVPPLVQGSLYGSDLVLGHAEFPLDWVRAPGDTVRFNPSASFRKVDGLELYHELYGLTAGATYRYTLSLRRQKGGLFAGKATALTLSGEDRATGVVTPVRRYLDVKALKPGQYEVRVLYESDTAGSYEVRRSFNVQP